MYGTVDPDSIPRYALPVDEPEPRHELCTDCENCRYWLELKDQNGVEHVGCSALNALQDAEEYFKNNKEWAIFFPEKENPDCVDGNMMEVWDYDE